MIKIKQNIQRNIILKHPKDMQDVEAFRMSHNEHSINIVSMLHTLKLHNNTCLILSGLLLFWSDTALNFFLPTVNSSSEKLLIMQIVIALPWAALPETFRCRPVIAMNKCVPLREMERPSRLHPSSSVPHSSGVCVAIFLSMRLLSPLLRPSVARAKKDLLFRMAS